MEANSKVKKDLTEKEFEDMLRTLADDFLPLVNKLNEFLVPTHYTAKSLDEAQTRLIESRAWVLNAIGLLMTSKQLKKEEKATRAEISTS